MDPEVDMSVKDPEFRKAQRKMETLEGGLAKHPLAHSPTLQPRLTQLRHKLVCLTYSFCFAHGLMVPRLILWTLLFGLWQKFHLAACHALPKS